MSLKYFLNQHAIILLIVFSVVQFSCKKDGLKRETKVETKTVSKVLATTAKASEDVIDLGLGITV
jgi:hypothetical protein